MAENEDDKDGKGVVDAEVIHQAKEVLALVPYGADARDRHFTIKKKKQFLQAFSITAIIADGLTAADVSRATLRKWLERDEKFRQKFIDAQEAGADVVEKELWVRAVKGVPKNRYDARGNFLETEMVKSDLLLMMLIKGMRPMKYKERMEDKDNKKINEEILEELKRLGVKKEQGTLQQGKVEDAILVKAEEVKEEAPQEVAAQDEGEKVNEP